MENIYTLNEEVTYVKLSRLKFVASKIFAPADARRLDKSFAARTGTVDESRVWDEFVPLYSETFRTNEGITDKLNHIHWPVTERGETPPLIVLDCHDLEDPTNQDSITSLWVADGNHRGMGLIGGALEYAPDVPADKKRDLLLGFNKFGSLMVPVKIATCKPEHAKAAFEELSGLNNTNTTKPLTTKEKQSLARRLYEAYHTAKLYADLKSMKERIAQVVGVASIRTLEFPEYLGDHIKADAAKKEEDFINRCRKDYELNLKIDFDALAVIYNTTAATVKGWYEKSRDVIEGKKTLAEHREEKKAAKQLASAQGAETQKAKRGATGGGKGLTKNAQPHERMSILFSRSVETYNKFFEKLGTVNTVFVDESTSETDKQLFAKTSGESIRTLRTSLVSAVNRLDAFMGVKGSAKKA